MIRLLIRHRRGIGFWLAGVALIVASFFARTELTNAVLLFVGPFVAVAGVAGIAYWFVAGDLPDPAPAPRRPGRALPAIQARAVVSRPAPRALVGEVLPPVHQLERGESR